jgi:hypothetical protein
MAPMTRCRAIDTMPQPCMATYCKHLRMKQQGCSRVTSNVHYLEGAVGLCRASLTQQQQGVLLSSVPRMLMPSSGGRPAMPGTPCIREAHTLAVHLVAVCTLLLPLCVLSQMVSAPTPGPCSLPRAPLSARRARGKAVNPAHFLGQQHDTCPVASGHPAAMLGVLGKGLGSTVSFTA